MKLRQIFSDEEWELLCDQCGVCCFYKIEDEDTEEIFFTTVYCPFLSLRQARCKVYSERFQRMPSCVKIAPETIRRQAKWMPASCAYRRIVENRPLPAWHPLFRQPSADSLRLIEKLKGMGLTPPEPFGGEEPNGIRKLKRRAKKGRPDDPDFVDTLISSVFPDPLDEPDQG